MKLWIDAQLPPAIAIWIRAEFGVDATAVRDIGLRDAEDREIFLAAKKAKVTVMTKDQDFLLLLDRLGPPPQIIWLTCGNTSNQRLKAILSETFANAAAMIDAGEAVVEINTPF